MELYQQVLSRDSEDPRAVPVLCCFDEFYVLARDHQYHDEISVYYNTINYVDSFEGIDIESNKISIFFPAPSRALPAPTSRALASASTSPTPGASGSTL